MWRRRRNVSCAVPDCEPFARFRGAQTNVPGGENGESAQVSDTKHCAGAGQGNELLRQSWRRPRETPSQTLETCKSHLPPMRVFFSTCRMGFVLYFNSRVCEFEARALRTSLIPRT